jgi:hypothetical protein
MKREDIIGQKLFETYKLSEFYLNLIVNNTLEEESPLQLANAFTQKLFEIAERYDRLLEANKQKEQFTLSFDHTRSTTQIIKHKPPLTPTISLGRCSTPNKSLHLINTTIHSASSTPSEQPSTPSYLNTFFRKSNSSLSLNKNWNVSTSNLNMMSRKQSHKHYYTRQLAHTTKSSSRANSNETHVRNQVKLCQRIASIYYGSESDEESDANNQANETVSDDMDIKYEYGYRNDLKYDNDILKFINESPDTSKKGPLLTENDLLVTSTSSSSNSSAASTSSSSAPSNNYESSINSETNSTLSGNLNETPINIGKSFSNLSKDSGVFMGESYHSNVNKRLFKNEESGIENEEDDEDDVDEEESEDFQGKNLNSPSSQELNESEEPYEYDESPNNTISRKLKTEFKQNLKNTTAILHEQQPAWNPLNSSAPVIKQETASNQIPRPIPSLKEQFLKNHPIDSRTYRKPTHDIRTRLMQSEFTSKIKYFNNVMKPVSDETSNFNGIEPGLMSMMIDSNNDGHFNLSNSNKNDDSNLQHQNHSTSVDNLNKTKQLNNTNKSDAISNQRNDSSLFFNNSLMNVSMLDNIQATNNLDFMSSSILTFE